MTLDIPLPLQTQVWVHRPGRLAVMGKIVGTAKPIGEGRRYDVRTVNGEVLANVEASELREAERSAA